MRLEMRCAIWKFLKLELLICKLSDETWKRGAIWNFWNLKLFKPIMGGCLFETFRWDLKMRCAIWNFFNPFKPIMGDAYLKLSDESWNKICYLKCLKLETFWTCHGGLLIWNFQMRLEMRCAIWKLFNPSQELVIWNFQMRLEVRCAIWNFSTFSNPSWELLIWNFQMRLETRYSIWNIWNLKLFKHVMGVAYLKLSDETWKRGAIWNFWNLKLFKPIMGGLLIWNFQMRLENEMCYLKLFNLFKPIMGDAYFKLSDESWNKICYLKCLKLETFRTYHGGLLIWNFQMRLEMRCAIWSFSNFSTHHRSLVIWNFQMRLENEMCYLKLFNLFKPIMRAAYLKLSDESWNKICYLKCLKLETFQTCHGGLLIWNFQMRLEMRCAIWNFSNFSTHHRSWLFETLRWDLKWDVLFETFQPFQTHHESCLF